MDQMLLIPEPPLQVLPSLAVAIGLEPAMLIQQVHYWCLFNERAGKRSTHYHDGKWWTYAPITRHTDKETDGFCWQDQFPFWPESTIRMYFTALRDKELVYTGHFSRNPKDRTLWYSPNYAELGQISHLLKSSKCIVTNSANASAENQQMYTETNTPETTTENTSPNGHSDENAASNGSDLFGSFNPQKGSPSDPRVQRKTVGYLSLQEQVNTLLERFTVTAKPIPFLVAAYRTVFNVTEPDYPPYPTVGRVYKKAEGIEGNSRLAGELLIRLYVQCAATYPAPLDPILWVSDALDAHRRNKSNKAFVAPTKEDVEAHFIAHGSTRLAARDWFNWQESRAWEGVRNWKPLAESRAAKNPAPKRNGHTPAPEQPRTSTPGKAPNEAREHFKW